MNRRSYQLCTCEKCFNRMNPMTRSERNGRTIVSQEQRIWHSGPHSILILKVQVMCRYVVTKLCVGCACAPLG